MSRKLARLLGKDEAQVSAQLSQLEKSSGYPSEDVRILAENRHRLRTKISQLGLDPDDTTDEELYHALLARYSRDSEMINKVLGTKPGATYAERLNKAVQLVQHCASSDEAWVVKNSTLRAMLAKNSPKHTAKLLGYRSVSSMIKREDTAVIHLIATVVESKTWTKASASQINKLNGSNYELRPVKILKFENHSWSQLAKPDDHVINDPVAGAVAVWPSKSLNNASVLGLTLLLLKSIHDLNPTGYSEVLHEISPALRWWADADYLISDSQFPVSFNLKDVALNHLKNHDIDTAHTHHAARSFWNELTGRYQKISDNLSAAAENIESKVGSRQSKLPIASDLEAEYAGMD